MEFTIQEFSPKKLVGKSLSMSFVEDKTGILWASFGPKIKEIKHRVGEEKFSIQFYSDSFMKDPNIVYTKWATVEVSDYEVLPDDIETLNIIGGTYAVFSYIGNTMQAANFFTKIFHEWLPNSKYEVDNTRPHFEILPAIYNPLDEKSKEQICIPVQLQK